MKQVLLLAAFLAITAPIRPCQAQQHLVDLSRAAPEKAISTGLTSVSHGVQIANGRFVFVDRAAPAVLVADFATNTLVTLGRKGEGPNEYRGPSHAMSDGAGGAIIPDPAVARALGVNRSGELTGSRFLRPDLGGAGISTVRGMNRDGSVFYAGQAGTGPRDSLPIVRWFFRAAPQKTVAWWPMVTERLTLGAKTTGANGMVGQEIGGGDLWPLRTTWVVLPNEAIAIVRPDPYRVDIVRADGSRLLGKAVPYAPLLADAKVKEAYRKQRGPIPDESFPKALPRFEGLEDVIASDRNEVWVERLRPPDDPQPIYDIFDASAQYLGTAKLRHHSKVVGFGPGVVYVAREDQEEGFWYLERYLRK